MTEIKELQARAYRQSADKGFHVDDLAVGETGWLAQDAMRIALMHSELSEALEELRAGHRPDEQYVSLSLLPAVGERPLPSEGIKPSELKPEGVPSELADVVIRVMDYCETRDIDLQDAILRKLAYNNRRAHKHGGKEF